jgi:hypothetical protein
MQQGSLRVGVAVGGAVLVVVGVAGLVVGQIVERVNRAAAN